jgi:outer membrane protein
VLFPDFPNTYKARAEFQAPIYSFGRVSSNVAAAEADLHVAAADRQTVEADVRLDTMRAYWRLATLREASKVLAESLTRADASVSDVRSRVETGFLPPNDLLSAQAQRSRQQVQLVQARNEEAVAELDLARLIGVPPGTPIQITSPFDQTLPGAATAAAVPIDVLVTKALAQRSERTGLTARGEGLRQSAKAALANLNPYAIAAGFIEPAKPNVRFLPPEDVWRTSWALDVKLVWPLFDSGRSRAQAAGYQAQARATEARRDEFDSIVGIEIRQRLLDMESGKASIAASEEAIAAATEARRVVDERFRAGVATSTEVLDAQVALLEAQLERTRLNAGLRLSEARLLRALGER